MIYREYIKYTYNYALIKFTLHGEYGSCLKQLPYFFIYVIPILSSQKEQIFKVFFRCPFALW